MTRVGVAGIPGKGARQVSAPPDSPQPAVEGAGQAGGARLGRAGLRDSEDLGFSVAEAGSGRRVLSGGRRAFNRAPSAFRALFWPHWSFQEKAGRGGVCLSPVTHMAPLSPGSRFHDLKFVPRFPKAKHQSARSQAAGRNAQPRAPAACGHRRPGHSHGHTVASQGVTRSAEPMVQSRGPWSASKSGSRPGRVHGLQRASAPSQRLKSTWYLDFGEETLRDRTQNLRFCFLSFRTFTVLSADRLRDK